MYWRKKMTKRDYLPALKYQYDLIDLLNVDDPIYWSNYRRKGVWADILKDHLEERKVKWKGRHIAARALAFRIVTILLDEMIMEMILRNGEFVLPGKHIGLKIVDITHRVTKLKYHASTRGRAFAPTILFLKENTFEKYGSVYHYVRFGKKYYKEYINQLNSYHVYE